MPRQRAEILASVSARAIHIVPSVEAEAAGPAYSVVRLCDALAAAGVAPEVAVVGTGPSRVARPYLRVFAPGLGPARLGGSPELRRWLRQEAEAGAEILHGHSLWMLPNVYPAWAVRGTTAKLVVSPRGTLSPWAMTRNAWRKRVFWHLAQGRALAAAHCFHATAESEHDDLRRLGFRQPVCVLPNGVDLPEGSRPTPGPRRTLLYLGRIHPKKGIDVLLKAWARLEAERPDWDLRILGPDNGGHLAQMQRLALELKLQRVVFAGPVYGAEKLQAYRTADLFVLPTHSENFGMTVAEALAAGTPAVVTRGAPWQGLLQEGAGWWIDPGVEALEAALREATALAPGHREAMGASGRAWMARDFAWDQIGLRMAETYRWLREGGAPPPWVRMG